MTESDIAAGIRHALFAAIKYEKRSGPNGPMVGKYLGRPWVFKWIFEKAWARMCAEIVTADWNKKQTTKSLYNDPDSWLDWKFGVRQAFGRCLRYFVDNKMLPLKVLNPLARGTKYYGLIDQ